MLQSGKKLLVSFSTLLLAACGATVATPNGGDSTSAVPSSTVPATVSNSPSMVATPVSSSPAVSQDTMMPEFTFQPSAVVKSIENKIFSVRQGFALTDLVGASQECGTNQDASYYAPLLKKYAPTDMATEYHFGFNGQSQEPHEWVVTVMANKLAYPDLKAFQHDFDICAAGSGRYPSKVSPAFLLFESSCGSGFSDGSGLPNGCEKVKEAIAPTLSLRQTARTGSSVATSSALAFTSSSFYTNTEYGFTLDTGSWGPMRVTDDTAAFKDDLPAKMVFKLTAANDSDRSLHIFVIPLAAMQENPAINDAPMTLLKKNTKYAFFYDGSGDNAGFPGLEDPKWDTIYKESKQIVKTFKLL